MCAPGFHQNETGSTNCVKCSVGHYADSPGMINCKICPQGTTNFDDGGDRCLSKFILVEWWTDS